MDSISRTVSRRGFLKAAGAAGGAALLAGCSPAFIKSATEIAAITFGEAPAYEPGVQSLLAQKYPNVKLQMTAIPLEKGWDGYAEAILSRIKRGEKTDLIHIPVEVFYQLLKPGILQPLNSFLDKEAAAKKDLEDDFHPTLTGVFTQAGQCYAFPFDWASIVMFYNTSLIKKAGIPVPRPDWPWQDFIDMSKNLTHVKGAADDTYGYAFDNSLLGLMSWFFNNDTSPFKNGWADSNMDDPKVAETLIFLSNLIWFRKVAPNPSAYDRPGRFFAERLAMMSALSNMIVSAKSQGFTAYNVQLMPAHAGKYRTVFRASGWGMAQSTRFGDAAWPVLQLLSSAEVQQSALKTSGNVPVRRSVAQSADWLNLAGPDVDLSWIYASLEAAEVVPSPLNFSRVDALLSGWFGRVFSKELSADDAVTGAHQELQAEMDKIK